MTSLTVLTKEIVAAFVAKNHVPPGDLGDLIKSVHARLAALMRVPEAEAEKLIPAVAIKKSVGKEELTCLFDGKRFKALKRHLWTAHGITPAQYREQWGLGRDYPMVAPNYSATRSSMAKSIGLGKRVATPSRRKRKA
jgi:predicted transcriptional regulator